MSCRKETDVRFSKTEIFADHVGKVRPIFSNQRLETANLWITGYY